jgi:excisionase family DNA binding protein
VTNDHTRRRRPLRSSITELGLPQLVTPEEAAQYLGVSAYTVRHRLKCGELPGRKHGSRWLIRVVDLAQYVEPNNAT